MLDDKRTEVRRQLTDAPLIVDHLCAECADHFAAVRAYPRRIAGALHTEPASGARARLLHEDHLRVRAPRPRLAIRHRWAAGATIGLMAELGGQSLSGIGFGLGIDRAVLACQAEGLDVGVSPRVSVFFVSLGDAARVESIATMGKLRRAGVHADNGLRRPWA